MWIVQLRRDGRASKRGTESWVTAATATRLMAEGRAAVVVGDDRLSGKDFGPTSSDESAAPGEAAEDGAEDTHLFILSPATLAVQTPSGRRRLHRYEAGQDLSLAGDQYPMARTLLRLGCASRELPPPRGRDSLVKFEEPTDVAGLRMPPGTVAALDFDPLSVLPELRGLGLYPWEILDIENLGDDGCQGESLELVRLVVELTDPWQPLRSLGFLGGVFVDTTYRDYRRQLPTGRVIRAYATHGDHRPPFAVLASEAP